MLHGMSPTSYRKLYTPFNASVSMLLHEYKPNDKAPEKIVACAINLRRFMKYIIFLFTKIKNIKLLGV